MLRSQDLEWDTALEMAKEPILCPVLCQDAHTVWGHKGRASVIRACFLEEVTSHRDRSAEWLLG